MDASAGVWTDSSDSVISAGEQKRQRGGGGVSGRPGAAGAGGKRRRFGLADGGRENIRDAGG